VSDLQLTSQSTTSCPTT